MRNYAVQYIIQYTKRKRTGPADARGVARRTRAPTGTEQGRTSVSHQVFALTVNGAARAARRLRLRRTGRAATRRVKT